MALHAMNPNAGYAVDFPVESEVPAPMPAPRPQANNGDAAVALPAADAVTRHWALSQGRRAFAEQTLTNACIVSGCDLFRGTVHVVGGRIAAVDTGRSAARSAVDLQGDLLIPGLVDIHTDNLERHLEPRPGVDWPSLPALLSHDRQMAAAGVTTVCDALCIGDRHRGRVRRQEMLLEAIRAAKRAQREGLLKARHLLHLRCEVSTEGVVETVAALVEDPGVRLVSLMDHTPGQRQWRDLDRWRRMNRIGAGVEELEAIRAQRRHFPEQRAAAARRDIAALAGDRGLALASHDDTTAEHVAEAAAAGVGISEFPTTEEAAQAARAAGLQVVMGAPNVVLGGSHSGNVSARVLAVSSLIDGLASDYVPMSLIEACFVLHQVQAVPLPAAIAMATAKPAAML
ncbi:MAG TPA: alpha-D-ribose 1-methylphosphonate 5-triphosphate diphosphatase, partial [Rhodospirillales bacterium]|nr:alpha-D-ribose 1-methylphosphonate 5-triphosphate diphosphatase [Rhodospirillales bacterium]